MEYKEEISENIPKNMINHKLFSYKYIFQT